MNVVQPRPSSFITGSMNKISRRVAFGIASGRAGTLSSQRRSQSLLVIVRPLWRNTVAPRCFKLSYVPVLPTLGIYSDWILSYPFTFTYVVINFKRYRHGSLYFLKFIASDMLYA